MEKESKKAPAAERMIKVKVRPGGNLTVGNPTTGERTYYKPGDTLEVTEREYRASKHSLVSPEDERAEAATAVEAAKPADTTALFRAFRHRARAATAQRRAADDERQKIEIMRVLRASGWTPPADQKSNG